MSLLDFPDSPIPGRYELTEGEAVAIAESTIAKIRQAILDIDAHATPLGSDDDGFVTGGYVVSVGAMHRALGLVGHTSAPCGCECRCCRTEPV